MNEIEERAETQLRTIEMTYSIKIKNREYIAHLIAGSVKDKRQVLMVCTAINSWIAGNNIAGEVEIPQSEVLHFIGAALERGKDR